jgi:hypothetical protein
MKHKMRLDARIHISLKYIVILVDSIGFRRWCITHRITGVSDFILRPDLIITRKRTNTTFRKLDVSVLG